ncbi:hypothetical protein ACLMJK_006505 [Lecanora helva]
MNSLTHSGFETSPNAGDAACSFGDLMYPSTGRPTRGGSGAEIALSLFDDAVPLPPLRPIGTENDITVSLPSLSVQPMPSPRSNSTLASTTVPVSSTTNSPTSSPEVSFPSASVSYASTPTLASPATTSNANLQAFPPQSQISSTFTAPMNVSIRTTTTRVSFPSALMESAYSVFTKASDPLMAAATTSVSLTQTTSTPVDSSSDPPTVSAIADSVQTSPSLPSTITVTQTITTASTLTKTITNCNCNTPTPSTPPAPKGNGPTNTTPSPAPPLTDRIGKDPIAAVAPHKTSPSRTAQAPSPPTSTPSHPTPISTTTITIATPLPSSPNPQPVTVTTAQVIAEQPLPGDGWKAATMTEPGVLDANKASAMANASVAIFTGGAIGGRGDVRPRTGAVGVGVVLGAWMGL